MVAKRCRAGKEAHIVQPVCDGNVIGQRGSQSRGEQPRTSGRDGHVNDRQKATLSFTCKGSGQFEIGARRRIHNQNATGVVPARRPEKREPSGLGERDIRKQPAKTSRLGSREGAEGIECGDPKKRPKAMFG